MKLICDCGNEDIFNTIDEETGEETIITEGEGQGSELIKESDLWSLDRTFCNFILPRLKAFKEININSYPMDFKNTEEWHDTIDKMIFAFQTIKDNAWGDFSLYEEILKKYEEGMQLFAEHFCSLWD